MLRRYALVNWHCFYSWHNEVSTASFAIVLPKSILQILWVFLCFMKNHLLVVVALEKKMKMLGNTSRKMFWCLWKAVVPLCWKLSLVNLSLSFNSRNPKGEKVVFYRIIWIVLCLWGLLSYGAFCSFARLDLWFFQQKDNINYSLKLILTGLSIMFKSKLGWCCPLPVFLLI